MVPSLREWLSRKQKETRRGRAELRLAERSWAWNAKPDNRHLPSVLEWASIRLLTKRQDWTEPQRKMMAGRRDARPAIRLDAGRNDRRGLQRGSSLGSGRQEQGGHPHRGAGGPPGERGAVPGAGHREATPCQSRRRRDLAVAAGFSQGRDGLTRSGATPCSACVGFPRSVAGGTTRGGVAHGQGRYVLPIRPLLRPYAVSSRSDSGPAAATRKRTQIAASAPRWLWPDYVPESDAAWWTEADLKFVAEQLVSSNAEYQPLLREALRPIRARLLGDLERIFADAKATDAQRLSAANAFADYAEKNPEVVPTARRRHAGAIRGAVSDRGGRPHARHDRGARQIAATAPPEELGSVERIAYGQRLRTPRRRLLRLGEREKALPVLDMSDDPEALTQFIFRCRPRGVGVDAILDCLQRVSSRSGKIVIHATPATPCCWRWVSSSWPTFPSRGGKL